MAGVHVRGRVGWRRLLLLLLLLLLALAHEQFKVVTRRLERALHAMMGALELLSRQDLFADGLAMAQAGCEWWRLYIIMIGRAQDIARRDR